MNSCEQTFRILMEMKLKSWLYASAAEVEMSGSECEEKLILRKGGGHLGSSA